MSDQSKFCTECGEKNPISNEFCTACGHHFSSVKLDTAETKSEELTNQEVNTSSKKEPVPQVSQKEKTKETKETSGKLNKNFVNIISQYILANKLVAGAAIVIIVAILAFVVFFSGSNEASGSWTTTDTEYYSRRERYSAEIKSNGNVEILLEHADDLNGTILLTFSIEEDNWESTETRKAYGLNEMDSMEISVPNLTYENERSELLSEFAGANIEYEVNEGRDDVTIIYDLSTHGDELFGPSFETILELVDENDADNSYGEEYIIFSGFYGQKELFSR